MRALASVPPTLPRRLQLWPPPLRLRIAGIPAIVLAALTWSTLGPFAAKVFETGMSASSLGFWRILITGALFMAHAQATRSPALPRALRPRAALYGLSGIASMFVLYGLSLQQVGVAIATVLINTAPAWVALLSWAVYRERLAALGVLALGLTIAGVGFVAQPGRGDALSALGLLYGLGSGLVYALYSLQGAGRLREAPAARVLAWAMPAGALALSPFATWPAPAAWLPLLALCVLSTYLPFALYLYGLRTVDATRGATLLAIEPAFAITWAWIFLGERIQLGQLFGGALAIFGIALMTHSRAPKPPKPD